MFRQRFELFAVFDNYITKIYKLIRGTIIEKQIQENNKIQNIKIDSKINNASISNDL